MSPLVLAAAQLAVAAVTMAVASPFDRDMPPHPSVTAIAAVVILGVLGTGLALVINFMLITSEGPTAASVVTYLLPPVALTLGIIVLGEPANWTLPMGAVIILLGVALVRRSRPANSAAPSA